MKNFHLLVLFQLVIFFSSCRTENNDTNDIIINLKTKIENNPMGFSMRPFHFFDSIPTKFSGVYNKDSSFIGCIPTINKTDFDKFYSENKISKAVYDTTSTGIYCLSGYKNGKQFYSLDLNSNNDFSDDRVIEFDKNLTNKTKTHKEIIKPFPILKMGINRLENNRLYKDNISVKLFPNTNYFTYTNKNPSQNEKLKRKLLTIAKFVDYPFGVFSVNDVEYKVAIGKYGRKIKLLFREKDSAFYKYNDFRREEHQLLDTLEIEGNHYRIDKFSYSPLTIKLKKLNLKENIYGFRKGKIIRNQQIVDLEGNTTSIKNLFNGKEMILLDFWGTWCAPCKELTPDLVTLNKKYGGKISFVSLAYEKDSAPVKQYTMDNGMDWFNGIIKGNPKSGHDTSKIIENLRVNAYPTFILLNSDLRILFRGHGGSFHQLESFLNEYLKKGP